VSTLTPKEHERLSVIRKVLKRELRQKAAGALLRLSTRQIRNLGRKVHEKGARGRVQKLENFTSEVVHLWGACHYSEGNQERLQTLRREPMIAGGKYESERHHIYYRTDMF
jgi:hypothetical protein